MPRPWSGSLRRLILRTSFFPGRRRTADRDHKALVAQLLKFAEIAVAAIASRLRFPLVDSSFFAVFLFGIICSLFSPIKYGILPDHLDDGACGGQRPGRRRHLPPILLGTIVADIAAKGGSDPIHFAWLMMLTALASWAASLLIMGTGEGVLQLTVRMAISPPSCPCIGLDQVCVGGAAAVVGRDCDELVLARRRHRAVAAAVARDRQDRWH